jgi:hypothetical protein
MSFEVFGGHSLSCSPLKDLLCCPVPFPLSSHSYNSLSILSLNIIFLSLFLSSVSYSGSRHSRNHKWHSLLRRGSSTLNGESIHHSTRTQHEAELLCQASCSEVKEGIALASVNSIASVKLSHSAHQTKTPVHFVATFLDTQDS